jgi:hypothetical protein
MREYVSYRTAYSTDYQTGIVFWAPGGQEIVNFPKQHRDNCSAKNQNSLMRFKPTVRILKNYRNTLVDSGKLKEGVAPSYFLEGLLWNLPNTNFMPTFGSTMNNFVEWVGSVDATQLSCANDLHWLVRDNAAVCWPSESYRAYVAAIRGDW